MGEDDRHAKPKDIPTPFDEMTSWYCIRCAEILTTRSQ